jgi:hypothetical protein
MAIASNYRLQPKEILSDATGDELNAWLAQHAIDLVAYPAISPPFFGG